MTIEDPTLHKAADDAPAAINAEHIRDLARAWYGSERIEDRAAELARDVANLTRVARRAAGALDFNVEPSQFLVHLRLASAELAPQKTLSPGVPARLTATGAEADES